jgi:hypothetical protein
MAWEGYPDEFDLWDGSYCLTDISIAEAEAKYHLEPQSGVLNTRLECEMHDTDCVYSDVVDAQSSSVLEPAAAPSASDRRDWIAGKFEVITSQSRGTLIYYLSSWIKEGGIVSRVADSSRLTRA